MNSWQQQQQNYYAPAPPAQQQQYYAPPANSQPYVQSQQQAPGVQSSDAMIGPMLRYTTIDIQRAIYTCSALIVSTAPTAPYMSINYGTVQAPYSLDRFQGWNFYRYDISLPIPERDSMITYTVAGTPYTFFVAGKQTTSWRWAFWSCNGFSSDIPPKERDDKYGGKWPLWEDLLDKHKRLPFHAMVGGGDQIYCDPVFDDIQAVKWWCKESDISKKANFQVSPELNGEIENWYFNAYKGHFGSGPYAQAMKTIPFVYVTDDHDIFDGWGSYPERVMRMPLVQALGRAAFRFYMLFQHHSTDQMAVRHGLFGAVPRSNLTYFGPQQAILLPCGRSERNLEQIISRATYDQIFQRLRAMPQTVRHLIVVLGVPIVYPRLKEAEKALGNEYIQSFVGAVGIGNSVNQFGLPELLDDLSDHWTAEPHIPERRAFIERLQQFAREKHVRVTFIAGDVHCCGAGYLSIKDGTMDPARDPRYMVQIVSSAIINAPPPSAVIKVLHTTAKTYKLNDDTEENMFELFKTNVEGKDKDHKKLYNRRNYAAVRPLPDGGLEFTILVERKDNKGTVPYVVVTPPPKY